MNRERKIQPGEFYRHFKNRLYQVLAVAVHSENGEPMVVYQALYGTYQVYVRPYEMFAGEVDHQKYPDVKQRYRFEKVTPGGDGQEKAEDTAGQPGDTALQAPEEDRETGAALNEAFLSFLDTDDFAQRMEALKALEGSATQRELDSIYLVLDMKAEQGTVKEQIEAIRRFLTMQNRFDGKHLR